MACSAEALRRVLTTIFLSVLTICIATSPRAQQVDVRTNEIGGVVTSTKGAEAGVWVIAETTDLPTKFARIVVTDDQGRYVLPDMPVANYQVWVRGYGLVDSPKLRAKPGQQLNIASAAAAHYYPAIYWYSMMKIPGQDQFGPNTKCGIPGVLTQIDYLKQMKNIGC